MSDPEKKKVLLIEDDPIISSVYVRRLNNLGYEAQVYARGDGAVERVREIKPDVLVLDLILPGKDGEEVLEELKKIDELKNMPIIVLSNVVDQERKQVILGKGADAYLVKAETDLDEVTKTIQSALAD